MNKLFLYNTLARKKEEFKPIKKGLVNFYHCGPTVYWTQHIGNLRGMTVGDIVARSLKYLGYKVKYVRNYTDVGHLVSDEDEGEDKMEKAAKRDKMAPLAIAEKYIKIFENDTAQLNILEPYKKPRATKHINEMIKMVASLIDKGYAYTTDLAVYFDVNKAKDYTKLSGQNLEENISGLGSAEVVDNNKKNPCDFALWFFKAGMHKNALQFWPSPFKSKLVKNGEGFPGWHIECSAMSRKYLGKTIDLHLGGVEHIPVHHTNEIAQSEAANGVKFVNFWLHNEHLLADNKKMSKSEGTGFSLDEVKAKGFKPLALRYFFLQAHYRSKENFTWEALAAAENGLKHLRNQVSNLVNYDERGVSARIFNKIKDINNDFKEKFIVAIADDFNTPQALAVTQELLKSDLPKQKKLATVLDFDKVLGLDLHKRTSQIFATTTKNFTGDAYLINASDKIEELIKLREKAREEKNWPEADKLRQEIEKLGYIVEDTKGGQRVSKK